MRRAFVAVLRGVIGAASLAVQPAAAQATESGFLSGTDKDHTVPWEFMVSDGRCPCLARRGRPRRPIGCSVDLLSGKRPETAHGEGTRRSHQTSRGLLRLHSRYGPYAC